MGILINNSLDDFSWGSADDAVTANHPAPGKRVRSTISPMIVFGRDERPWLVAGTPGGS
jgi:gamma-glutamyltranspeptidase/glutathione hydrolase